MNRVFRMLAGVAWLIVGVVNAQELSKRRTEPPAAEKLVFVPNDQAMSAKQRLLDKIAKVGGEDQRPANVVLILADDLGYADTSIYGSKSIPTPHIDALAAGGVRFTDAYVTAATCSPSRAGLMSGRYQQRFGFEFNTSGGAITYRDLLGNVVLKNFRAAGGKDAPGFNLVFHCYRNSVHRPKIASAGYGLLRLVR